jgi:Zn-dependent protease with chaperone function
MPGGKIAFFTGILEQLKLSDDEVAMVMGHEMAHALREHARARMAKSAGTGAALSIGAQLLGLGQVGDLAARAGTQLITLKFSRGDETEADLVGWSSRRARASTRRRRCRCGRRWPRPRRTRAD